MAEHTPTPWKQNCFLITGPRNEHVTHTGMGNLPPSRSHESEANAAFIVKAVNNHEALVSALRFILAFYDPGQNYLDTEAWKHAEAGARRALKDAERTGADVSSATERTDG